MLKRSIIYSREAVAATIVFVACLAVMAFAAMPALAVSAPVWRLTVTPAPSYFMPESAGADVYWITAVDVGGAPTDGSPVTISDVLPEGVTLDPAGARGLDDHSETNVSCEEGPPLKCVDTAVVVPDEAVKMIIPVDVAQGAETGVLDQATVSGGGAPSASTSAATTISAETPPAAFEDLTTELTNSDGSVDTQAGSHPYEFTVRFALNSIRSVISEDLTSAGEPKDVIAALPPGLTVNPTATSVMCTETELESDANAAQGGGCPAASQVGIVRIKSGLNGGIELPAALFNMVPPANAPAELGFDAVGAGIFVHLLGGVRTGSDFGVTSTTNDILQKGEISVVEATLWGNPTDSNHDTERGLCVTAFAQASVEGCPSVEPREVPFVTLPSSCSAGLPTTLALDTWQAPGSFFSRDALINEAAPTSGVSGCERLPFDPSATVAPTEPAAPSADAPSGLEVNVHVPQEQSNVGLAEADVKDVVVSLPSGMTVSPSAANGLGACVPGEVQLHTEGLVGSCPDSAKIGSAEVVTPLLAKPLQGAVYVAQQGNAGSAQGSNPFNSLLALYLIVEGSGVRLKLAGHVEADSSTGQLTARFEGNPPDEGEPQIPFSDLRVKLFGGPRAALSTPEQCGNYTSSVAMTPWSGGATVARSSSFNVSSGCSSVFAPSFAVGMSSAQAGAFAQLQLSFGRQDGEQSLRGLEATLPPGLIAKLSGVPLCDGAQAAAGSCPAASRIGSVTVGAGPGPDPVYVAGNVYLTGPYNGGPFGEVVEVPAIAGPFNLGNVIVRGSIRIDPNTAQATIVSDPFPTILQGIPLQVKTVNVSIDRPGFTLNPTNCRAESTSGALISSNATRASVSSRFQVGGCGELKFAPKLTVSTAGKTSKANGASLHVKLVPPHEGPQSGTSASGTGSTSGTSGSASGSSAQAEEANIARIKVDLPKQLPSRLTTLQKACTAAVFDANPAACPAASIAASAKAITPILPVALEGPAYFVSHGNEAFPQLILVLQGYGITIDLVGDTFISKVGITSSTFAHVPDAPVTSFELTLPQGKYSGLTANANLCTVKGGLKMPTEFVGQNGAVIHQSTPISVSGCPKAKALTRSQKLKAALRACHKKPKGAKRSGCEKAARKKYGAVRKAKKK
jgi:hypothetical protein